MSKQKEILIDIIELYKDMSYLWNKNDENYKNQNMRNESYQVLLSLYKRFDKNATIKTLKKKIDNLKTNYLKEAKKVRESKRGAGNEDIYVPTIWYYDAFSFLEPTTESCHSVKKAIEIEDSSSSCADDNYSQVSSSTSSTSNQKSFKKKKKEAPSNLQKNILQKASKKMKPNKEDWEILGRSIGIQLRGLNQRQHTIARKLISDVIFYANLNKLSEESGVSLTPTKKHRGSVKLSYPPIPSRSSPSEDS